MKHQSIKITLGALLASSALAVSVLHAAPSISIKVTSPKGTGGEVAGKYLKKAAWTPCLTHPTTASNTKYPYIKANTVLRKIDSLQFEVSIKNEGANAEATKAGNMQYDTYFYFVPPLNDLFYAVTPGSLGYEIDSGTRDLLNSIDPMIMAEDYLPNHKKVVLFGAPILLDGASLPQGQWKAVAFMVDKNVTHPASVTNWEAFDVKSFVLGSPNPASSSACN